MYSCSKREDGGTPFTFVGAARRMGTGTLGELLSQAGPGMVERYFRAGAGRRLCNAGPRYRRVTPRARSARETSSSLDKMDVA